MEFNEIMVFNTLMPGNFFGGRMLMPFEHYSNMKRLYFGNNIMDRFYPAGANQDLIDKEPEEKYHTKSLLGVMASSAKVTCWIIDKVDMNYLPESACKHIFEQVVFSKEEDRPFPEADVQFIIDQFQKWDRFKVDFVESIFERKAIDKFMQ